MHSKGKNVLYSKLVKVMVSKMTSIRFLIKLHIIVVVGLWDDIGCNDSEGS